MEIKTRKKKKKKLYTDFGADVTGGKSLQKHYGSLSVSPKGDEVVIGEGFFDVPTEIKGKVDFGIKKFLVFYFDSPEEYERCVELFGKYKKPKKDSKNPPIVDTAKLMRLIGK